MSRRRLSAPGGSLQERCRHKLVRSAVSRSAVPRRLLVEAARSGGLATEGSRQVTVTAGGGSGSTHTVLETRLGTLTLVREGEAMTGLYFPGHWPRPDRSAFGPRVNAGFEEFARQLSEYLSGDRSAFELPLMVKGAEFDRRVWELVAGVPYGQTITYGEIARP